MGFSVVIISTYVYVFKIRPIRFVLSNFLVNVDMLCTDLLVTTRIVYKIFKRNSIVLSTGLEPNISKCKDLILAKQKSLSCSDVSLKFWI